MEKNGFIRNRLFIREMAYLVSIIIVLELSTVIDSVLSLDPHVLHSCSPTPGVKCRRCDCKPDCMDLSDEKNCSYGSMEDFLLPVASMYNTKTVKDQICGTTSKFFPAPPLPPFSLCDPPATISTTRPTQPPSTTVPNPPTITPISRPTTAAPRPATETSTPFTPPFPRTTSIYPSVREVWDFCRKRYASFGNTLYCAERIYYCLQQPKTCTVTTTTTTMRTTTSMRPHNTGYYDYYHDYYWNWI